MTIYKAIKPELLELKKSTFRIKSNCDSFTPPVNILSFGPKRVHISIYGIGRFYFTTLAFINMIWQGVEIIDTKDEAKYYLSKEQHKLLDI